MVGGSESLTDGNIGGKGDYANKISYEYDPLGQLIEP
jgi:hypothetical protein